MSGMTILPTTMVGSYPRPYWFTYQLQGRDALEAFKLRHHAEAFEDAVRTVLKDQEEAGLDILTDGQMWFDDYGNAIGSFVWYWYERLAGFDSSKHIHPLAAAGRGDEFDRLRWNEMGATAMVGTEMQALVEAGAPYLQMVHLPRFTARAKLQAMVAEARLARERLGVIG